MTIPTNDLALKKQQSRSPDLVTEATKLVDYISKAVENPYAFGSFTGAVYNTAWLSMIRKPETTPAQLLFPICFQDILDRQVQGSGWYQDGDFDVDSILNTLGGLLAYKRNLDIDHKTISRSSLLLRIESATQYLEATLKTWDVLESQRPGFQILIPAMLEYLEADGICFDFPSKEPLLALNREKLAKLPAKVFYAPIQTTVFFILECFVGKIDFSKCRGMLIKGCMGSSPVATAAYLMNSPWDTDAERYLQDLVKSRTQDGQFQGIPDTYASTGFEVLWVSAVLLENGFTIEDLPGIKSVLEVTDEFYRCLGGVTGGFSPMGTADSDTTGKSITVRNMLGRQTGAEALITKFESDEYFLTYPYELRPSFTPNCNILTGLLSTPCPAKYVAQIEKCLKYICSIRMGASTDVIDKWSITELYPIAAMSESLVHFFKNWEEPWMKTLPNDLTHFKAPLVLVQALHQVLNSQNDDGSWGTNPSPECTSYAIIALANFTSVPFVYGLREQISTAIEDGRKFLSKNTHHPTEILWSGKTTYTATAISKAYVLAALKTKYPKYELSPSLASLDSDPGTSKAVLQMLKRIPQTTDFPTWKLQSIALEATIFRSHLCKTVANIFGRRSMDGVHHDHRYLDIIPVTMVLVNDLSDLRLRADVLREIMALSIIHFEYDDFVEHVMENATGESHGEIAMLIEKLATGTINDCSSKLAHKLNHNVPVNGQTLSVSQVLQNTGLQLRKFVDYHLHHLSTYESSTEKQRRLRMELSAFIQHGIRQNNLSKAFYASDFKKAKQLPMSFQDWIRTTGIVNSGAFPYYTMLENFIGQQCLPNSTESESASLSTSHLLHELAIHIAIKGRFTNDRVSIIRDRKEANLNCVDFPEFCFTEEDIRDEGQLTRVQNSLKDLELIEVEICKSIFKQLSTSKLSTQVLARFKALQFVFLLEGVHGAFYELRSTGNI